MKIFELIREGKKRLQSSSTYNSIGGGIPQLDAEVILSSILNRERIYLHINREKSIDKTTSEEFFKFIERRSGGEPVQYIAGKKEFMGLDFSVRKGVLIPRNDTEVLVEEVINRLDKLKETVIVDVGCGSGAISVSLAKYLPGSIVYALDIMDIPIEVTRENAVKNGVEFRVHIIKSDLMKELGKELEKNVDVIVSNPPYIEDEIIPTLSDEVKNFEPYTALSGGVDGLNYYNRITASAGRFLKDDGMLAYEIGYNQRESVTEILKNNGFYNIECIKDLAGHDRVIIGHYRKIDN